MSDQSKLRLSSSSVKYTGHLAFLALDAISAAKLNSLLRVLKTGHGVRHRSLDILFTSIVSPVVASQAQAQARTVRGSYFLARCHNKYCSIRFFQFLQCAYIFLLFCSSRPSLIILTSIVLLYFKALRY